MYLKSLPMRNLPTWPVNQFALKQEICINELGLGEVELIPLQVKVENGNFSCEECLINYQYYLEMETCDHRQRFHCKLLR